jgi:hypothetical protein
MSFLPGMMPGFAAPAPASEFSPLDIGGLQGWWRSDQGITKDGSDRVGQWDDLSGNSRHLTASGTARPTWLAGEINGFPGIDFDGAANEMDTPSFTLTQPFHFFVVFRANTWASGKRVFSNVDTSTEVFCRQNGSTPQIGQSAGIGDANHVSATLGNWHLFQAFFSGGSSFQALDDDASVSGINPGTQSITGGLRLAERSNAGNGANIDGTFAEFAVYGAQIAGADLTALKSYFNSRYALW